MSEDDEFLRQFEARTLPFDQWHHRAHLKVAYLYLTTLDFDSAAQRIGDGIRAYNVAHHVEDTPTSGWYGCGFCQESVYHQFHVRHEFAFFGGDPGIRQMHRDECSSRFAVICWNSRVG